MMLLQEEIKIPAGDFSFFLFFCCFLEISRILWQRDRDRVNVTVNKGSSSGLQASGV